MITNDKGIVSFRHMVIEEVCRLAWQKNLTEETKNELVYKIIPGPKPQFRCFLPSDLRSRMKQCSREDYK